MGLALFTRPKGRVISLTGISSYESTKDTRPYAAGRVTQNIGASVSSFVTTTYDFTKDTFFPTVLTPFETPIRAS